MCCDDAATNLHVLDASVKPEGGDIVYKDFAAQRIAGARFADLTIARDFSKPYPFMMPDKAHFTRVMKAMDIRRSHTVVIYEQGKGWFATRAAFMLRAYGHPRVFVLDGGLSKWSSEGRAMERDDVGAWDAEYDYNLNNDALVSYDRVKEISEDGSVQIIECRPPPAVQ